MCHGESSNWRHDWFRFCNKSYAGIVAGKVNSSVNSQVDNYPWKKCDKRKVESTESVVTTCDKNGLRPVKVVHKRDMKIKKQGVNTDQAKRVKQNMLRCEKQVSTLSDKWQSQSKGQFVPVNTKNRYWPLIDVTKSTEAEVVIQEAQGEKTNQKVVSHKCVNHFTTDHTYTMDSGRVHSGTVGGHTSDSNTNAVVAKRVSPASASVSFEMQDKYELALKSKPKHKEKLDKAANTNIFKEWDNQTVEKFGFIPISEQKLANKNSPKQLKSDLLEIHSQVSACKGYNFLNAQIQVPSQLHTGISNFSS